MAGRNNKVPQTAGIDKIESFLQNYFKQLIIALAAVVVIFIGAYAVYSFNQSTKAKKADLVGEVQSVMTNNLTTENVKIFYDISLSAPFLKNYIDLVAGEEWATLGDNASALQSLASVSGDYKEMAASLSFDLGDTKININDYVKTGTMKPLWYYRLVLSSTGEEKAKNLEQFRTLYPDSKLLTLLENWN